MKAKMDKPVEPAVYLCAVCDETVSPDPVLNAVKCCDEAECVIVYIEDSPEDELFYTSSEWLGG